MLLRNIDPKRGLSNGVPQKIIEIHTSVIEAEVNTGTHFGNSAHTTH